MVEDKDIIKKKKKELLEIIGKVVRSERKKKNIGINRFSYEYDIGNGLVSRLENGATDVQISTLWKISNAFGLEFSSFISLIEKELPEGFNFYE